MRSVGVGVCCLLGGPPSSLSPTFTMLTSSNSVGSSPFWRYPLVALCNLWSTGGDGQTLVSWRASVVVLFSYGAMSCREWFQSNSWGPGQRTTWTSIVAWWAASRLIDELDLRELPLHGRRFTWCIERDSPTIVKLDHVFFSTDCEEFFPSCLLQAASSIISDHCALLLYSCDSRRKHIAFTSKRSSLSSTASSKSCRMSGNYRPIFLNGSTRLGFL